MKALTLHQPWASFVTTGIKVIETRSWRTHYRGPLAIHAAARKIDSEGARLAAWAGYDYVDECFPLGVIVATCTLVDCVEAERVFTESLQASRRGRWWRDEGTANVSATEDQCEVCDFTEGRWAWLLGEIEPVDPPIPVRGKQGLWTWESA